MRKETLFTPRVDATVAGHSASASKLLDASNSDVDAHVTRPIRTWTHM